MSEISQGCQPLSFTFIIILEIQKVVSIGRNKLSLYTPYMIAMYRTIYRTIRTNRSSARLLDIKPICKNQ